MIRVQKDTSIMGEGIPLFISLESSLSKNINDRARWYHCSTRFIHQKDTLSFSYRQDYHFSLLSLLTGGDRDKALQSIQGRRETNNDVVFVTSLVCRVSTFKPLVSTSQYLPRSFSRSLPHHLFQESYPSKCLQKCHDKAGLGCSIR